MSNPDPLASPSTPSTPASDATPGAEDSAHWYYALKDQRHGPVSLAAIRGMVERGELALDDLVWRSGMADWEPVVDVDGLLDASAAPPIDIDPETRPTGPPPTLRAKEKLREASVAASAAATATARATSNWVRQNVETRTWVLVGLMLTLLARGCDSLAEKDVQRRVAIAAATKAQWEAEYSQEVAQRNKEIAELESRGGKRSDLNGLKESRDEYQREQQTLREELEAGKWAELSSRAEIAVHQFAIHSYWRHWVFLIGSVVLTVALGAVAISNQTPDRWIAMTMLGIILWSVMNGW